MPRPLNFKNDSVEAVKSGSERLTVRPAGTGYERGDLVKAMVRRQPAFAELRITKVERLSLDDLKPAHARRSGRQGLAALQDSVRAIYPNAADFDVISFEVLD